MTLARSAVAALSAAALLAACTGSSNDATDSTAAPTSTTSTTLAPTTTPAPTSTTEPPPTTAPPDVVVMWVDPSLAPAVRSLAEEFSDPAVVVEIIEKSYLSIRSELHSASADELPDLFVGAHEWTGEFEAAGVVAPIKAFSGAARTKLSPGALSAMTLEGQLYAIPFAAQAAALWANSSLAGTTPPATFDDLLSSCDSLADSVTCLAVPGGGSELDAYHLYPFLSGSGGSILRYEPAFGYIADEAGIDSAEGLAAAAYIAELVRAGYVPPLDYLDARRRFEAGEAAYWLTGPWELPTIDQAAAGSGFEVTAFPLPSIDGIEARPFVTGRGVFLAAGASPVAEEFLIDVLATEDGIAALAEADEGTPTHADVIATIEDPRLLVFAEAVGPGIPTPNIVEMTDEIWDIWGSAYQEIRDGVSNAEAAVLAAGRQIRRVLGVEESLPPETGGDAG